MTAASFSHARCDRIDPSTTQTSCDCFELRFARLFNAGRGYAFPCDADGHVDIDGLGEKARVNYLYARTVIGREFFAPVTCSVGDRGIE